MAIAIKSFEKQDIENFEKFLTTERKPLPELKLAPLVHPHEDIAVVAFKKEVQASPLLEFAEKYNFVFCAHDQKIVSLSRHTPAVSADHKKYIFSGYAFYEGKMVSKLKKWIIFKFSKELQIVRDFDYVLLFLFYKLIKRLNDNQILICSESRSALSGNLLYIDRKIDKNTYDVIYSLKKDIIEKRTRLEL